MTKQFLRLQILLLATLGAAFAQPTIVSVSAYPSHGCVMLRADTTNLSSQAGSTVSMSWGTTAALGFTTPAQFETPTTNYTPINTWTVATCGLAPATPYYVQFNAATSAGSVVSSCTNGQTGTGWTCQAGGGKLMITTSALPANHGEPLAPTVPNTDMPAVTGSTLNVASDCSDLQAQLTACSALDKSLVHQVRIPASAVCSGAYTLPVKTGTGADTGTCIVRSAAPDSALPPEHTRVTTDYASAMPLLQLPYSEAGTNDYLLTVPANSNGWRIGPGLRLTLQSSVTPVKIAICGVTEGNDYNTGAPYATITTCTAHGLSFGQNVHVAGVQGFDGRGPNGVWQVNVTGATTLLLYGNYYAYTGRPTFSCGTPPCWVNGTGYIMRGLGWSVTSVTQATPPVVTTAQEHGLSNWPWNTISSISGSTITLANGHTMANVATDSSIPAAVEIAGSSVAAYNGRWAKGGTQSGNTFIIANGPASSCIVSCGQIRYKQTLRIENSTGATTVNGNHIFTVVDDTHITIDDASAGGAYTGGGVLSVDPDHYVGVITTANPTSRIVVDRVWSDGAATWPVRQIYAGSLSGDDSGIVDSVIEDAKMWNAINPVTLQAERSLKAYNEAFSLFVTQGHRQRVHNSSFSCMGICVFAEEWSTDTKHDFTFTKNIVSARLDDLAGSAGSNGKYFINRQRFELKGGERFDITGNTFENNGQDTTPCGAAMIFTPRAYFSGGVNRDININDNVFRRSGSGIQVASLDGARPVGGVNQRFKIDGNLFYDLDLWKYSSVPNLVGGRGVCGYSIWAVGPTEDLTITHNTAFDTRGVHTTFLTLAYTGGYEGLVVRNNIYTHNHDNGHGAISVAGDFSDRTPSPTGTPNAVFNAIAPAGSVFSNNVVIPGVKNSSSDANYLSTSTSTTYDQPTCAGFYSGFTSVTCTGNVSGGDTAAARAAEVMFTNSTARDFKLLPASPFIHAASDFTAMGYSDVRFDTSQGTLRNVRVSNINTTGATINFVVPDACTVEVGTGSTPGTGSRTAAPAALNPAKAVPVTGLTPSTVYNYWVHCPSRVYHDVFKTQ